jgi:uncharacterized protein YkwD
MADYINDWYYMEPDFRSEFSLRGPVSLVDMRLLFAQGKIHGKTQVRCGADSLWHHLEDVMPLFSQPYQQERPKARAVVLCGKTLVLAFAVFIIALVTLRIGPSFKFPTAPLRQNQFAGESLKRETLIRLTNEARRLNGLTDLTENDLLDTIAEERGKDMIEKQYFAHVSPSGEGASDVAQRTGYQYKIIAENIAKGSFLTNQKLIDGWMQSPGHRKNILSSDVREIGVSILKGTMQGDETWVGVQIFGLQSPPISDKSCKQPSSELVSQITAKKSEIQGLNEKIVSLRQELDRENTSIETERIAAGRDYRRNYELNGRISAHNEKVNWYNQLVAELREKGNTLNSMVDEHNRTLQEYKNCQSSH